MKRQIVILAMLAAALGVGHAAESETKPAPPQKQAASGSVKNVGVNEFEQLRNDKQVVVLDVRTPKEYAAGHIPGSVNIDFNAPDFDQKIAKLDTNKTYLVHCAVGGRSAKACTKLSQTNFQHLYNLEGGMKAWEKQGNKPER